jgi:thiamine pyrophosphate-dependent acetolactate synthase large subunit-like protein
MARAFGAHAEHVERPDELAPALRRAAASGIAALVNVRVRTEGG